MSLNIIILAAGQGTRMYSRVSKVLHLLAGTSLLEHVVNTAKQLSPEAIHVVYGHGGEHVRETLSHLDVNWVSQTEQLGTGHAVSQAIPYIAPESQVLVLYGDVPLISLATLQDLYQSTPKDGIGIIGAEFPDPSGLGRIVRDSSGNITGIVEHRDANEQQLEIKEIYSGIMTLPAKYLIEWLPQLTNQNSQCEYYFTDIIKLAVQAKRSVIAVLASCAQEVEGVNDRFQLADLERHYQLQAARKLMLHGASLMDPNRFDLRGTVEVGQDVTIDVNVLIEGNVIIGANSYIGPNCVLRDVAIGEGVRVRANSVLEKATIENNCIIGPFARVRPGTHLASGAKIGNFVEVKNAQVGSGSKINHLSYVGDATLGEQVNVGAGTITCNYDGVNKHRTVIADGAFIGSNTQLVAPVRIGEHATIGAGSTITKDAPANALTLSRSKQSSIDNWKRPEKMNGDVVPNKEKQE